VSTLRTNWLILLTVIICHALAAQTASDFETLLKQARAGTLAKMTYEQFQIRLREFGLGEEEARKKANEFGIDIDNFLTKERPTTTTTTPGAQQPGVSVQVSVPAATTTEAAPTPESVNIYRDTSPPPKGPQGLEYFGYQIFKQVPAAFEPSAIGPVDPGYLLGVGDVIRLTVWGQAEFQYELEVDREGRVFIPNVGQVFVLGTPLRDLQQKLKNTLAKYYSGLATSPPRVLLDVTIAKLRPLRVFVMGEVKQPGGYTISTYATVFNALYAVGGPLVRGSLRGVKVLRDNKVVATVDLYDYLLRGDQTSDVRLQNNDLIFVPPRGKSVAIRGEVRRPAIYELKENEQLRTLIDFAGGLLPTAYVENAQIDRVKPFDQRTKDTKDRIVVDLSLKEVIKKGGQDFVLFDADEVQVFSVLDEKKNYVTIEGSVWRPGRFELADIKSVRNLVNAAEGVLPRTYLERAHLIRLNEDEITTTVIPFNLGELLADVSHDISLHPRDRVVVYSTEVTEIKDRVISIHGQVKKPGTYALKDTMSLMDLILEAGGFGEGADTVQAEVSRLRPEGLRGDSLAIILQVPLTKDFSQNEVTLNDPAKKFLLRHRDQVLIRPNPDYRLQQNVTIEGEFTYPGVFSIKRKGEKLSEILTRAGGPTTISYLGGAQYYRNGVRLIVDLEEAYYQKDPDNDIVVLGGDRIIVPQRPRTVLVTGEVNKPGLYSFIKGAAVSDYLERAGEVTDSADYALLTLPTGETRKVGFGLFSKNPKVLEGSSIYVVKEPSEPPEEKKIDWGATIKDSFAIAASAATIIYLVSQVTK